MAFTASERRKELFGLISQVNEDLLRYEVHILKAAQIQAQFHYRLGAKILGTV